MTALINRLAENSLLPDIIARELVFGLLIVLAFIIVFLFIRYLIKSKKKESFNIIRSASSDYWYNFGWIALSAIVLLFLLLFLFPYIFHWFLLLFILGAFLLFPLKFIYFLVGGRNSLRGFLVLFIITQLLFTTIYYIQINEYSKFCKPENTETKNIISHNKVHEVENIDFVQILLNTFHTALIQELSPYYVKVIEDESYKEIHNKFFLILNIQIFISWLYLGVLIASLYNKITNR